MRLLLFIIFFHLSFFSFSQSDLVKRASNSAQDLITSSINLFDEDKNKVLISILIESSEYAVNQASDRGGFNNNQLIRILLPEEAKKIKNSLNKIGLKKQIQELENNMNYSAEHATKEALIILIDELKKMTIQDIISIIRAGDNAATVYFKNQTSGSLYKKFKPIIFSSMEKFSVIDKWNYLVSRYNKIPLVKKVNPDLVDHITLKTIDGLFVLIGDKEKEIRDNPNAEIMKLLNKY